MKNINLIFSAKNPQLADLPDNELQKMSLDIIKLLHGKPLSHALVILHKAQEIMINGPYIDINSPRLLAIQKEYNLSDL